MELAFERRGAGPPLVLLHGIGHHWQAWLPVLDRLAAERDVIAVDFPGFGVSPPLPPGSPYTAESLADAVESFCAMLIQADRFGTSISESLRVLSDLLRTRRRMRAEERAAKIALKLLFPLIFCIFPALMMVLLGPAMIHVYRVLLPTFVGMSP